MNPDWDKLEACQQSLREHMAEIERLKSDLDEWRRECRAEIERLKAQVDALMLEFCPDEMTPEQVERWGENQKPALAKKEDKR